MALEGNEVVGRRSVLDNGRYNKYNPDKSPMAFFYHFCVVEDRAVRRALCDAAFDWARSRGLGRMWGPRRFIHIDGPGVLVEGFEHHPAMDISGSNTQRYLPQMAKAGTMYEVVVKLGWVEPWSLNHGAALRHMNPCPLCRPGRLQVGSLFSHVKSGQSACHSTHALSCRKYQVASVSRRK
jgi:hypothetical protein